MPNFGLETLRDTLTDTGYRAGWAAIRHAPDGLARKAFGSAGGYFGTRGGGPDQLRRNLARVLGVSPAQVPDDLMAASMASYARYWYEAFRLPSMDFATAAANVHITDEDIEHFDSQLRAGRGVIFALPHSGNYDMAGVWLVQHYGTFATVAERLKPESLFRRFLEYRESLGFEIFPLTGGEQPPFAQLADRLRDGKIICLMGERDLTRKGVPVTMFGEPTRMPAGAAKLAIETGAALFPVHHWFTEGATSRLVCGEELDTSAGVDVTTQRLADAFAANIAAHPADWHMLQPFWESDWSHERRERIANAAIDGEAGGAAS
ncbi:putative acyltransferase [Gordonia effusa NBRC 100432]|uniref:Putative acyltransferase n=1 Tax=Gordonia effusa NBRC 100432 TaxID=1077974 RepID=H0QZM8_9ACTN|nr:phosphatidylinositol mannoside acyltransferase [Gordonia effusa]GAB18279.1 putative acyltransferase [Gordonia effusa NBRC 100432]